MELHDRPAPYRADEPELPEPPNSKGKRTEVGFRADMVLPEKLLIELKAVEVLLPVHQALVITYLKILSLPLGLLINFNEVRIKDGIHRILNVPRTPPSPGAWFLRSFVAHP